MRPANSSKPVRLVNVPKSIRPASSNKIVILKNLQFLISYIVSNKPVDSKILRPVNSSKPLYPVNEVNMSVLLMFVLLILINRCTLLISY